MKKTFSKLKDEKGQATVEFALIGILVLILLFAIVEFSRGWYRADKLKGAANIAARTYAITKDSGQATSAAKTVITNWDNNINTITIDSTTVVSQVTVTVSEKFNPVVSLLPMLKNINIQRDATYRLE